MEGYNEVDWPSGKVEYVGFVIQTLCTESVVGTNMLLVHDVNNMQINKYTKCCWYIYIQTTFSLHTKSAPTTFYLHIKYVPTAFYLHTKSV